MEDKNPITYFAETDKRNKKIRFGIKSLDRTKHIYIIGKTGMGKSVMLENMAIQDIKNGNGIAFIDPHGKTADLLLDYIPEERIEDVIYFAPFDTENPISFNVMEDVGPDKRHLVAQGLLSAFKKIWGEETFSDRMEHITNNTLLALLEYPGSTMLGMTKIFTDAGYRKKVVDNITDPSVKAFWTEEFVGWDDRYRRDAYAAILNKVGQFISNPLIRNIVGQPKSSFNFRDVLDNKKILLVNLSVGQVGEANADLLGSMLTTKIYLAAMSRADVSQEKLDKLPNFYLYIDEFQNLANDSFADILSQARKYKLNLTIAHQYIEQMPEKVNAAVFGNVGTMIAFRVGATDAELLEKEFSPEFLIEDLVNLDFTQIYLKLMIDGIGSTPFSARTLPPIVKPPISFKEEIIEFSRKQFTRSKSEIEKEITDWHKPIKVQNQQQQQPIKQFDKNGKNISQSSQQVNSKTPRVSLGDLRSRGTYKKINNVTLEKKQSPNQTNNRMQLRDALSNAIQNVQSSDKNEMKKSFDKSFSKSKEHQQPNQQKYEKKQEVNNKDKEIPKDVLEKMLYVKNPNENG